MYDQEARYVNFLNSKTMGANKLNKEEIVRVLAMYWGCDIEFNRRNFDNSWIRAIEKVSINFCPSLLVDREPRLRLTPLSKITDEHAVNAVLVMHNERDWLDPITKSVANKYKSHINEASYLYDYNTRQYLLSVGYAVPLFFCLDHWANGKTAIELGIAIEKATL